MTTSQSEWQRHSDMQVAEIKRLEALCRKYYEELAKCKELLGEIWSKYSNSFDVQMPKETFDRIYEASK